jgi:glycosyltransferase involved in cell wall biosynthesis
VLATKEQLEMFPSSTRHMVVRNFCPLSVYGSVSNDADRPYDLVHCGGWSPQRGCYVLIETLRILVQDYGRTDCRLLLIGVARDSLQPDVEKRILDYGLERQVEFRGVIPLHDVPRELARAKIGLMCHQATTQYRTGVATKLFDYMAAGLAIVGGYADCDREFAPEGTVKIYVDQTKPDEYAAAVNRLLNQPELRAQMGQNARRLFEERYTAEAQADALIQFYREHLPLPAAA